MAHDMGFAKAQGAHECRKVIGIGDCGIGRVTRTLLIRVGRVITAAIRDGVIARGGEGFDLRAPVAAIAERTVDEYYGNTGAALDVMQFDAG